MIYKNFQPKLVYPFLLAVIFSGYLIVKLAITPHMKEMSNLMKRFLTLLFRTLLLTRPTRSEAAIMLVRLCGAEGM